MIWIKKPLCIHVFTRLSVFCLVALLPWLNQVVFWYGTFSRVWLLIFNILFTMATSSRGQLPARRTKVVDPCPGPLKEGRKQKNSNIRSRDIDAMASKPAL